jgi:hypothetical protein
MDGFKTLPKMQFFKEGGHAKAEKEMCYGGSTSKKMKAGGDVCADDEKQDKAMIKKAFKQHDEAEHDKEPTEIKLKKGGRSKKEKGTVKKFKSGGEVKNVYEAKKSSGDLDNIEKVKDIKPKKAAAPSKASEKPAMKGSDVAKEKSKPAGDAEKIKKVPPTGNKKAAAASGAKEMPNKYKTGGEVKKYADGRKVNDPNAVAAKANMDLEEALNPISMARELARRAKSSPMPSLPAGYGNLGMPGQLPANPSMNQYQMQAPQNPGMQQGLQQAMPQQNPMMNRIPGMN